MYGPFSTTQTLNSLPSFLLNCFNFIAADKPAGPLIQIYFLKFFDQIIFSKRFFFLPPPIKITLKIKNYHT
jgi:hypothetical protein